MPKAYMTALAREQRQNMTPAGRVLWEALRDRRLEGARFKREHVLGRYIADFYCPVARLVIELDGAVHNTEEAAAYDAVRDEALQARGVRVLRFRNDQVLNHLPDVLETIKATLALTPNPSPTCGRGELASPILREDPTTPPLSSATLPLSSDEERGPGGEV
jgi:very-short-patch-repair endonuclease